MNLIKLERREQFEELKKGDTVVVHWNPGSYEYKKGNMITSNSIHGMHNGNELILNKKTNSYFNIDMYLRGESNAKSACLLAVMTEEVAHERSEASSASAART